MAIDVLDPLFGPPVGRTARDSRRMDAEGAPVDLEAPLLQR
jgi:hypothetical protein